MEGGETETDLLSSSLTLCLWLSGIQNIMTMDMGRFKILTKLMVCLYFCGGQKVQVSARDRAGDWIIGGPPVTHLSRSFQKAEVLVDVTVAVLPLLKLHDMS